MSSTFPTQLYQDLEKLVSNSTKHTFVANDLEKDGVKYRVYKYGIANFTDFNEPNALNARGVMFNMSNPENPVLVCLPLPKFFNYEESGTDHSTGEIGTTMIKVDGSLLSTFMHKGELAVKTKSVMDSSQVYDTEKFLNLPENEALKAELTKLTSLGFTVNMEYTAPFNRIVVRYDYEKLTLLSIRSLTTGESLYGANLTKTLLANNFTVCASNVVGYTYRNVGCNHKEVVDAIRKEQDGEGYILEINDKVKGTYLVKVKTEVYALMHKTKEFIESRKNIFECVIDETIDDMKSMFVSFPAIIAEINAIEQAVGPVYNKLVYDVETFHKDNAHLSQKDYAIKAKAEQPAIMSLLMCAYSKKEIDIKKFAKAHRADMFGIA